MFSGRNSRFGLVGRLIEDVGLLFSLGKDFFSGRYRRVPAWTLVMLMLVLIYIISPFDIIPDFIIGYGQIDDALVAFLCLYLLEKDLLIYKEWRLHQLQEDRRGHK